MIDTGEKLKGFYPTNLGIIPKKLGYSKIKKNKKINLILLERLSHR